MGEGVDPSALPALSSAADRRLAAECERDGRIFATELECLPRENALYVLDRYEQQCLAEAARHHVQERAGADPTPFTPRLSRPDSERLARLRLAVKSNCRPASEHPGVAHLAPPG
jgi:hypothetical protein